MECLPKSSDLSLIQNHWNELECSLSAAVAEWEQITPARFNHCVCSGVSLLLSINCTTNYSSEEVSIKYKDNMWTEH